MQKLLKRPEVERITTPSRSSIYLMMSRGEFPRPVKVGKRAVGWRGTDILAWLESREESGE
jgi:prophage regulatory protein